MQNEGSVEISRPIDLVFRLTNEHVAEWSIVVVESNIIEEKPGGVGSTFQTVTMDRGQRMEFLGVVTRYVPPTASSIFMTGKMFDLEVDYIFERTSTGTRVTQQSRVKGKGIFGFFLTLFGWMMSKASCKALQLELNSLKKFCEEHQD